MTATYPTSYNLFGDESYNLHDAIPTFGLLESLDYDFSADQQHSFQALFNDLFGESNNFTKKEEDFINFCFEIDDPSLKQPSSFEQTKDDSRPKLTPEEKERYTTFFSDVAADESWFELKDRITGDVLNIKFEDTFTGDSEDFGEIVEEEDDDFIE